MNNTDWTAEDIFIQLILDTNITLHDIKNILDFLEKKSESLVEFYNKWIIMRDECLVKLTKKDIIKFHVNNWEHTSLVDASELFALREKIRDDELILVQRIYRIAYTEAIHADDELWDDR